MKPADPGVVVVALGGNLGGVSAVQSRLDETIESISEQWGEPRVSAFYVTAPVGPVQDQPQFVNAVSAWWPEVMPSARQTLDLLHALEARHGRVRGIPGDARTLDLDLLLHGSNVLNEPGLQVPHPRMGERAFVLRPLQDLFGSDFQWVGASRTVGELLSEPGVAAQPCRRLSA